MVAFVISFPLAWYSIHTWLESFAYKAPISDAILAGPAALLICVGYGKFRVVEGCDSESCSCIEKRIGAKSVTNFLPD